ncbi:MAG: OmpH family outer membrane protein [Pseudomonadota bacterium]
MRRLFAGLLALSISASGGGALAQGEAPTFEVPPPVVTINQDRLFEETILGRRIVEEVERRAEQLATENRRIEADLIEEEQALTARRPTLSVEEFRRLADAFDAKVQRLREEQDAKSRAVQRFSDDTRQDFFAQVVPILGELLRERGALIVIDRRDVFLSADSIDITDAAIAAIDAATDAEDPRQGPVAAPLVQE